MTWLVDSYVKHHSQGIGHAVAYQIVCIPHGAGVRQMEKAHGYQKVD